MIKNVHSYTVKSVHDYIDIYTIGGFYRPNGKRKREKVSDRRALSAKQKVKAGESVR